MDKPEKLYIKVREYRRDKKNGQIRETVNKGQRIPKGLSKMDKPEKLQINVREYRRGYHKWRNQRETVNKRQRIPKGLSQMDKPEKLATQGRRRRQTRQKTQHNMCRRPLHANTHK